MGTCTSSQCWPRSSSCSTNGPRLAGAGSQHASDAPAPETRDVELGQQLHMLLEDVALDLGARHRQQQQVGARLRSRSTFVASSRPSHSPKRPNDNNGNGHRHIPCFFNAITCF